MSKVQIQSSGCWNWQGGKDSGGYGQFWNGERKIQAHHFLILPLSKGKEACHKCDNRLCVRPSHIFIGSRSDNVRDCVAKGRLRPTNGCLAMLKVRRTCRGESSGMSKLTTEDVREIRHTPIKFGTQAELARAYGVSQTAIWAIIQKRTWRHVK